MRTITNAVALAALSLIVAPGTSADTVADFYKGRNVTIITATGAGSGYGVAGRILANYLKNHIPGRPQVVMQFMPGGGGIKMLNYLYHVAPKDGTYIGFPLKFIAINPMLGRKGLKYDARKFGYLGGIGPIDSVVAVWKATSPATSLEGMRQKQVIMGSTGKSSGTYITPTLMNTILGTKFKVVTGYKGMAPIELAMEKGEVHGRAGSWDAIKVGRTHWLAGKKKVAIVAQSGLVRNKDLLNVPTLMELAKSKNDKDILRFFANADAIGWFFATPPGVPGDRFAALRRALANTARDQAYVAAANAKKFSITPTSGEKIKQLVDDTLATPPALMSKIKSAMGMR